MTEEVKGHAAPADDPKGDVAGSDRPIGGAGRGGSLSGVERVEIEEYPEYPGEDSTTMLAEGVDREVEDLCEQARRWAETGPAAEEEEPGGFVSNARNAAATSEEFPFWAPAETTAFAIGSIVRHDGTRPGDGPVQSYGVIVETQGQTLGLDDLAVHVYETDARPPLGAIQPAPSRRRPVVVYRAKVLSSTEPRPRPVLSGPVYSVRGDQLLEAHGRYLGKPKDRQWLEREGIVLGFYDDGAGGFGVFAEERARVLGPKQGHIVLSGMPGAGKTSQFLALLIGLYAQLRRLQAAGSEPPAPRVAAVAFNVKGADLLFPDRQDDSELGDGDRAMWDIAGVDPRTQPFGRVLVYVPLAEDGLNRHTLRTNPGADVPGYSETLEFALGIADLWPYLRLFFADRSMPAANLLAEVRSYFERTQSKSFTLAEVLRFFERTLLLPKAQRHKEYPEWEHHALSTITSVYGRLRALGTTLGGLIDVTGTGFGLERLTDLQPYDLAVIDLERIMADPPDPEIADIAIKIVTHYVLQRLTEAVTRRRAEVDHVIVFADELNRLAPARGDSGVGEYLAHLARTTRDRGIVLFGAGQFRSGIHPEILKAAAVHYSMQTPEYELSDPIYGSLSGEFKARLTQLQPGETLLRFPSLRTAVFARFPRPFVLTGTTGLEALPPAPPRPITTCIAERLGRADPDRWPREDEVGQLVDGVLRSAVETDEGEGDPRGRRREMERDLLRTLRDVEMDRARRHGQPPRWSAWEQFRDVVQERSNAIGQSESEPHYELPPDSAYRNPWEDSDLDEEG